MKLHQTSCSTRTRITFTNSDNGTPAPTVWVVFSRRKGIGQWAVRVEDKERGLMSTGLITLTERPNEAIAEQEYFNAV